MTLSAYEKAQFESLTADFEVEDVKTLKKMEKLDKASAMSFTAMPWLRNVPVAAALIALVFMVAGRVTGNDSQMFVAGGIGLLCIWVSMLVNPHTPVNSTGSDEEGEQL